MTPPSSRPQQKQWDNLVPASNISLPQWQTTATQKKSFYFAKLDVKDGFWRMVVAEEYTWNFAYILPLADNSLLDLHNTELVVPDALQMGWCESPPFFCTASETAQDVIQELMDCPE